MSESTTLPTPASGTQDWLRLCRLDELPPAGARVCVLPEGRVAIFRTRDDRVFALRDQCPHKGGPLSQGLVVGAAVTCPLHGWTIDFDSGAARAPDVGCTARYAVRVEHDWVYLARQSTLAGDATDAR